MSFTLCQLLFCLDSFSGLKQSCFQQQLRQNRSEQVDMMTRLSAEEPDERVSTLNFDSLDSNEHYC